MAQKSYTIIYHEHGKHQEKHIRAYDILDALNQAKSFQYMRYDISVLYVKSAYGRCIWL